MCAIESRQRATYYAASVCICMYARSASHIHTLTQILYVHAHEFRVCVLEHLIKLTKDLFVFAWSAQPACTTHMRGSAAHLEHVDCERIITCCRCLIYGM